MKYGDSDTGNDIKRSPAMRRYFSEKRWITNKQRRIEREERRRQQRAIKAKR